MVKKYYISSRAQWRARKWGRRGKNNTKNKQNTRTHAKMAKPVKGIVVSNKMMKSVTVMVERIYKHPKWGKFVKGRKKYMVRFCVASPSLPLPQAEPPPKRRSCIFFFFFNRAPLHRTTVTLKTIDCFLAWKRARRSVCSPTGFERQYD